MKVKQENPITLSHSEIVFIKKLVKDEFKSSNPCGNLRLREKIMALCNKLNVLSFEQVVRKINFYNILELEISENYLKHIEDYSREKISISNSVRILMLDFAQNVSDIFCDFTYHTHYFTDEERQEEVKQYLEKINSDDETYRMFGTVNSFVNLVNVKHDFEQIFNYVFPMTDEEYIQDSETIVDLLNSFSAKYLFITRNLVENCFPIRLKREITKDEKEFLRFLLYKGDEIDYMKEKNIAPIIFKDKLNTIMDLYGANTLQELLIAFKIETPLRDSGLIWDFSLYKLKANALIQLWEKRPELIPEHKHQEMRDLVKEVKLCLEHEIYTEENIKNFIEKVEEFNDYDFLNSQKVQPLVDWVKSKPHSLEAIMKLQELMAQIDEIFSLADFIADQYEN